jgi:hypothetical protein
MEKYFDPLAEFWRILPPGLKWLVVVPPLVVGVGWVVYRYVTNAKPLNLLTVGEHRRRNKIEFIERCLESKHNDDPELAATLKEEWHRIVFQEITRIKAKEPMRRQLILLYEQSPSVMQWPFIKSAYYSLKEKDGKLIKGVSRPEAVFGAIVAVVGILMTITGVSLLFYTFWVRDQVSQGSLRLGLGAAFAYFFMGLWFLIPAFPAYRAWALQKYIPVRGRDGVEGDSHRASRQKDTGPTGNES